MVDFYLIKYYERRVKLAFFKKFFERTDFVRKGIQLRRKTL